ncbi:MAG: putrescine/spermidine ABC transporter permease [Methylobacterium sp.]|nr:putrescine/spermidine ABC transporter permease [Methylobacterium sp.]
MVLRIALSDAATALPPYAPHFEGLAALRDFLAGLDLENFGLIWEDPLYWQSYLFSLRIAALTTLIALAIGYPLAYAMASAPMRWRAILLVLVILPFWTSFLIRVYAWIGILRPEGLLDMALAALGLSDQPLRLLNTETAVLIGMVYSYLPFMVLPLYATLEKLDRSLLEAAADLGATPLRAFLTVTLPLSLPGILAGSALVFIPAIGEFVIPDLLGGPDTTMIGKVLWTEFFSNRDWPLASAVAVVLLVVLVLPLALLQRARLARASEAGGRA